MAAKKPVTSSAQPIALATLPAAFFDDVRGTLQHARRQASAAFIAAKRHSSVQLGDCDL